LLLALVLKVFFLFCDAGEGGVWKVMKEGMYKEEKK